MAMFVVAVFAAGIAAFGPIYLNSTNQTILTSTLRAANPGNEGLTLQTSAEHDVPKRLDAAAAAVPHPGSGRWYGRPMTTDVGPFTTFVGKQPYAGTLVSRTGVCRHVHIVSGHCATRSGTVILSTRTARLLTLSLGGVLLAGSRRGEAQLRVVGLYAPGNPNAPYWWDQNFFSFGNGAPAEPDLDAAFASPATVVQSMGRAGTSSFIQLPFAAGALPVASVGAFESALAQYTHQVAARDRIRASSQIGSIIARAGSTEHTTGTIVEVVDLELALLAIFVLYFVASRTAAEREPDVRLAALRGFRPQSVLGVAMAEPVVLVGTAVPVGLLLAWLIAGATASATFGAGVGAAVTLLAVVAAVAAGIAGVAATGIGVRQVLAAGVDAPVGGAARTRKASTWRVVGDVSVVAVAAAAFFELGAAGVDKHAGSAADALAALAPALLALAVGVLGARLLPLVLRATHRRTAGSSKVTLAFATRRVARLREFAAPVMLVAVSVGLATFAVSGWAVAGRNRLVRSEVQVGAPTVLTVSVPPGATLLRLVHEADPGERAAMAAVLERASDGTTLAVDASSMPSVMWWPPALGVSESAVARRLVPSHVAPPVIVHGTSVRLTVDTSAITGTGVPELSVDLYDQSVQAGVEVTLGILHSGIHTYRGSLTGGCPGGCRLNDVAVTSTSAGGLAGSGRGTLRMQITAIEAEHAGRWQPIAASLDDAGRWDGSNGATVLDGRTGLTVQEHLPGAGSSATVGPADVPSALPTVVTPDTASSASGHGGPLLVGLDGTTIPGHTVAQVPDIPGVGAGATLVDLGTAERFLTGSFLTDTNEVWLAATAPQSIVHNLERRGVTVTGSSTTAAVGRELDRNGVSLAYLLFLIAAVAACALAVGATGFSIAAGARRHRAELAALHTVGVPGRLLRRFLWAEQALALTTGVLLGALVGLVAASVALRSIPEFVSQGGGPPLEQGLAPVAAAVTIGVVVVALTATVLGGSRLVAGAVDVGAIGTSGTRTHRVRRRHTSRARAGGPAGLQGTAATTAAAVTAVPAAGKSAAPNAAPVAGSAQDRTAGAAEPAKAETELGPDAPEHAPGSQAGVAVEMAGVVHLYHQAGVDVVGLRSVDLDVEAGEMLALVGPSGMGKTTVLRLMAGLMTASAGSVLVDGKELGQLRASDRRSLLAGEISYVVQDTLANVLPYATVEENLWFAQHGAVVRGHAPRWTPEWLLDYLGLVPMASARVATLPMGMQQQVAIASGVAAGPRLLLADEPTGQLTAVATAEVINLLHRVNASGTTVVIVTHDTAIASQFPRAITIRDGRVGAEAREGQEYAVIDRVGSVQLPPDVLERLRPNTRVRIVQTELGVELRDPGLEAAPGDEGAT